MKIAYVVSQFPNLTETFVAREIEQVVTSGHEATICILRPQPEEGPTGQDIPQARKIRVKVVRPSSFIAQLLILYRHPKQFGRTWLEVAYVLLRKPSRVLHAVYLALAAAWLAVRLEREGINYIHAHFLHSEAIVARWLAKFLQVPYGITSHVSSTWQERGLLKKVVTEASILVGDTTETIKLFDELYGREGVLLRNGIKIDAFQFLPEERRDVQEPPLILAAGYFFRKKGFHVLIETCALLRRRGLSFRCRIIGEGEERSNLERLVSQHDLGDCVEIPGALPFTQLREQYEQATVFVMPSIPSSFGSDGLPTVLIENMALGIPVVGTDLAGIPDLVRHRQTGMLAAVGNAESLADCLAEVLTDQDLRKSLALNGRDLIENEFDLRKNIERLVHLVETCTDSHFNRRRN